MPPYRRQGTHGEVTVQPGTLEWFRAVAKARATPESGLSARFVPGVTRAATIPPRSTGRSSSRSTAHGGAASLRSLVRRRATPSRRRRTGGSRSTGTAARRGLELAARDRRQRRADARADLGGVAHRMGDLLAAGEVQVREREVLGPLAPDLHAGEPVEVELERGERVVGRRPAAGLPVHDLPRAVVRRRRSRRSARRPPNPPAKQERRARRSSGDDAGEPALQERLPQPVDLARLAGELLGGEVRGLLGLEQRALAAALALDPRGGPRCRSAPPGR